MGVVIGGAAIGPGYSYKFMQKPVRTVLALAVFRVERLRSPAWWEYHIKPLI